MPPVPTSLPTTRSKVSEKEEGELGVRLLKLDLLLKHFELFFSDQNTPSVYSHLIEYACIVPKGAILG